MVGALSRICLPKLSQESIQKKFHEHSDFFFLFLFLHFLYNDINYKAEYTFTVMYTDWTDGA